MQEKLLQNLETVAAIASASKWQRLWRNPVKYLYAILFRELVYKRQKKELHLQCRTFFGNSMHILLPSSTDIFLTGGKSHESEITLAKFLIKNLKPGDHFLDIGAHYGYFSLLAAKLVGNQGKVLALEAAPRTFRVLQKNQALTPNLQIFNRAASDTESVLTFFEFPNLYSEYNTLDVEQFRNEPWFAKNKPKEIHIQSEILDSFLIKEKTFPKIIKIDVEGAEYQVLSGAERFLQENNPIICMEYLCQARGNEAHVKAEVFLKKLGYKAHFLDKNGETQPLTNVQAYLSKHLLDSDNIIFVKGGK